MTALLNKEPIPSRQRSGRLSLLPHLEEFFGGLSEDPSSVEEGTGYPATQHTEPTVIISSVKSKRKIKKHIIDQNSLLNCFCNLFSQPGSLFRSSALRINAYDRFGVRFTQVHPA